MMPIVISSAAVAASSSAAVAANSAALIAKKAQCESFIGGYRHNGVVLDMQTYSYCVDLIHPITSNVQITELKLFLMALIVAMPIFAFFNFVYDSEGDSIKSVAMGAIWGAVMVVALFAIYHVMNFIFKMQI